MSEANAAVDLNAVAAWMDELNLGNGLIEHPEPIGGGTQNVLLRFRRDGAAYVLRRGPVHLRPTSNDALRREMRVLSALTDTDVPHPRLIAACPDETVLHGAVFYLMEPVDGFNPTVSLPPMHLGDSTIRHTMGLAAADALARLGAVDYASIGLADLGRPEGFLERQVPRWLRELESYSHHDEYPGPDIPGLQDVARWLEANRPNAFRPGLMHGDYHLANLMYRRDGPDVAAIVDWEMSTVGDPLLDLGWLLATWPGEHGTDADSPLAQAGGLPSESELVERYAQQSTRDLSASPWYVVLACFKLGIILEGTYARACAGNAPEDVGARLHSMTLDLFTRAQAWIARN